MEAQRGFNQERKIDNGRLGTRAKSFSLSYRIRFNISSFIFLAGDGARSSDIQEEDALSQIKIKCTSGKGKRNAGTPRSLYARWHAQLIVRTSVDTTFDENHSADQLSLNSTR